jgi:hypothetical protein
MAVLERARDWLPEVNAEDLVESDGRVKGGWGL